MLGSLTVRDAALAVGAGLVVGCLYALVGVRSPAPPVVALLGLLGMLGGEGAVLYAQRMWQSPRSPEARASSAAPVGPASDRIHSDDQH